MKPVERVYIVVLVNDGMIMGGSMDTIDELMFLRYPVQLHYERTYPLPGDPNEISINYNAEVSRRCVAPIGFTDLLSGI